jgi:multiple sugar transport system substrate-binding protein
MNLGDILPCLGHLVLSAVGKLATWTFIAGGLVGALIIAFTTGALSLPRPGPEQDVILHVYAGTDSQQGARHRAIEAWNNAPEQKANRVQAVYDDIGSTADEQRRILTTALDSGSPTQVDLVVADFPDLPRFAHQGRLRVLDHPNTDGFINVTLQACQYQGQQWGLPLNADAPLLAYNVDLLAKGLQLTPQAVHDRYANTHGASIYDLIRHDGTTVLHTLQRTDPKLKAVFAGQFGDYEGFTVNTVEELGAEGADIENDRYLESQESRDAVRTMSRRLMTSDFLPQDSLASPGAVGGGYDEEESQTALREGTVLFARLWPANYKGLTDLRTGEGSQVLNIDAVPLPNGVLGGQAIAIADKSRHVQQARALLEFLTGDLSQLQLLLEGGYVPTRQIIYGDPPARRYVPGLLQAVSAATLRPKLPYYAEYSRQLRTEIRYALNNSYELSPDAPAHLEAASNGKLP